MQESDFVANVTARLNRLGVPACHSWPAAFDWLEAEVERLRWLLDKIVDEPSEAEDWECVRASNLDEWRRHR